MPPRTRGQRAIDIVKGLSAIAALVAILGGIPLALLRFGAEWLPKTMPTVDQAKDSLGRPAGDGAILTVLTLAVWVLWALFAVAVAVELASWARHAASPSTRRRLAAPAGPGRFRIPGLQNAAASLVMSALLVLPVAGAASASSSPPVPPPPAALVVPDQAALPPTSPGPTPTATDPAPANRPAQQYKVKRGDSPWRIAQRELGAGERWRELRHGDGRPLGREMIHPGQVLLVPSDLPAPEVETVEAAATGELTVVVRPGDSLWRIARERLGAGEKYPGIWVANKGHVMADGHRFSDPDLIRPGWSIAVPEASPGAVAATAPDPVRPVATPPDPAEADTAEADVPAPKVDAQAPEAPPEAKDAPVAPPTTETVEKRTTIWPPPPTSGVVAPPDAGAPRVAPSPAAPAAAPTSPGRGSELPPLAPFGIGGGVIAAGVVVEVRRRRRRQLARRRPDERLPELTEPAAAVARAVAATSIEDVDWLAAELRLLVRSLTGAARGRFEPTVVQYQGQVTIEVALARSCGAPPQGWAGNPRSKVWTLDTPHSPDVLAAVSEFPPCVPLLVSLGDRDEHGQVMLNLEASSAVGIVGEPGMVEGLVRSVLWELATSPLAEQLSLVTLGVAEPASSELFRWRPAVDVDDLAKTLRRDGTAVARALEETGIPSLPAARAEGEEAWAPTVAVVGADFATPEVLQAASGPGVVVIVVGACPADALEVHVAAGEVVVPSIGLICGAQQLTRTVAEDLDRLLAESNAEPVPAAEELQLEDLAAAARRPAPASGSNGHVDDVGAAAEAAAIVELGEPWSPPSPRVLVRLLGPPAVEGAIKPVTAQQLSGLAYLATHKPTTKSQVMEALWGDKPPGERRWRDFLSELRSTIPGGITIVPQVADGVVVTTDDLGSDVGQMEAFLARAATHPQERARCLQGATDLLRGVPFTPADPKARRYWRWVEMDYVDGRVFQQLAQAGHDLARIYLDAGDPQAAMGVAHKLLSACSLDPGLTEVLMEAYAAMGSVGAAERVFEAHDAALVDACGYEGASEETRLVLERIRRAEPIGPGHGRPLSLVRE